jgi:hypothetical protein
MRRWVGFVGIAMSLLAVRAGADEPATQPSEPAVLAGVIRYLPPAGWTPGQGTASGVIFVNPSDTADASLEICPAPFEFTAEVRKNIVARIRAFLEAHHVKILVEPCLEPDGRFDLREHDGFETEGSSWDYLRLYKNLGPQTVVVTVRVKGADKDEIAAAHKVGEELMVSAKYVKK